MKETHLYEKPEFVGAIRILPYQFTISTLLQPSGRVAFSVTGEAADISHALKDIAENRPIGIRDLIESINRTRSEMFRAKQAGALR